MSGEASQRRDDLSSGVRKDDHMTGTLEKSRAQGTKDQLQIWRWVHWSPEGEGRWGQGLGQYGLGACVKEEAFREEGMVGRERRAGERRG